jgi:nucleotide-binding universal stress UspA family protein
MKIKTVLVTTDLSDLSKKAFPHARDLAEKYEARIVVAFVEEYRLPPLVLEYPAVGFEEIARQQREQANERLRELAEEQLGPGMATDLRVVDGIAHVGIVQLAREIEADLIVMATHGRGFFSHAILGSTTERVVRRAPCPVLVVRQEDSE